MWGALTGLFGILLTAAMGFGLLWFGYEDLRRAGELDERAVVTRARVRDSSIEARRWVLFSVDSYQVQYELTVDGHTYFPPRGPDQWVAVDYWSWERASALRAIEVRYLPDAPAVNAPLAATRHGRLEGVSELLAGATCCGSAILPLVGLLLGLRGRGH
jgi:hypothetical protein